MKASSRKRKDISGVMVSAVKESYIRVSPQRKSGRVYGDLEGEGFVIEWHNVAEYADSLWEWSRSFQSKALRLCLNLSGHGFLQSGESRQGFEPSTAFLYLPADRGLNGNRKRGESHRFLTIDFSPRFLSEQLMMCEEALPHFVKQFIFSIGLATHLQDPVQITAAHEQLIALLLRPQCDAGACQLRVKGIVLQLMAEFLVQPCCRNGSSCDRQKCLARERVRGVVAILQRDFADPPSLEAIGREVGCSPFYLSRTFSREMGITIPQCLRTLRMRYAAELLDTGKCNVTEAAMAVGYSSLSHFSQAFCQTIGCCPAMYSSQASAQSAASCEALCSTVEPRGPIGGRPTDGGFDSRIDVLIEDVC